MRRAVLVLAVLFVVGLVLLTKGGGAGGRAERPPARPAMEVVPPPPSVSAEPNAAEAWRALGAVNAQSGAVEIVLEWEDGPKRRIGTGTVAEGRFAVDLPGLAEMHAFVRGRASIAARVSARGFAPGRSDEVPLKGVKPGEIRLDVTLEPGAGVRGRVVDETGRAVADADVYLSPTGGGTTTDEDGAFEIPFGETDARWLCARRGDVGVAAVGPLRLTQDFDAGDVVLRGPGRISGVALYPDGTPVREMTLNAVPEALRESRITSWPDAPFHPTDEGAPGGLGWGWTTTDDQGRFLIRGLLAGRYFFLEDESRAVFETSTDVRVTIDRYRILVRVVDESGAPAPGITVSARSGGDSAAGAVADLDVEPGDAWTIAIGSMDMAPTSVTVNVIPERREYEARLVARGVTARGRVEVRLLDPRGNPMESRASLCVGTMVLVHERPVDSLGRTPEVPVGEYRVVAIPKDLLAPYLPAEGTVTVRDGAVTAVTLEARSCGRLRLTLKGGAEGESVPDPHIAADPAREGSAVNFVPLHVRPDGSYTIGYEMKWGEPTMGYALLEPGPYELRIAMPGYEPVTVPLHVQPEAVTDAEVTLVPRQRRR